MRIEVLRMPVRVPRANASAGRWARSVRAECLDWLLIVGRAHLARVLEVYANHDNRQRPHLALGRQPPDPPAGLILASESPR